MAAHPLQPRYQNRYADYQIDRQSTQQRPADATKSHLLDLAAELRNEIYEWALLAPEYSMDEITTDWKPPGLLSVCRQTREETTKLFYQRRQFAFDILDCDGSLHVAWLKTFGLKCIDEGVNYSERESNLKIYFEEAPHGRNLLAWLEPLYAMGINTFVWLGRAFIIDDEISRVVSGARELMFNGLEQGRSWDDVQWDFKILLHAVSVYDQDWSDEEGLY